MTVLSFLMTVLSFLMKDTMPAKTHRRSPGLSIGADTAASPAQVPALAQVPGELNNIGLPAATSLNYIIPGTAQFNNAAEAFSSHSRILQLSAKVVF